MKKITKKCPFCGGTLTPVYNGNLKTKVILFWECSKRSCQFGIGGDNAQEGITDKNLKMIEAMQAKIDELNPDWSNAPEWANWLTYDKDGWFWWEVKPIIDVNEYLPGDDVSEWGMAEQSNINTRSIYSRPKSHKEVSE